ERTGCAGELDYAKSFGGPGKIASLTAQFINEHGELVTEGNWNGVLTMGAPGHHRRAMLKGLCTQRAQQRRHIPIDERVRGAQLQDDSRVHDVLSRRSPVDVL